MTGQSAWGEAAAFPRHCGCTLQDEARIRQLPHYIAARASLEHLRPRSSLGPDFVHWWDWPDNSRRSTSLYWFWINLRAWILSDYFCWDKCIPFLPRTIIHSLKHLEKYPKIHFFFFLPPLALERWIKSRSRRIGLLHCHFHCFPFQQLSSCPEATPGVQTTRAGLTKHLGLNALK